MSTREDDLKAIFHSLFMVRYYTVVMEVNARSLIAEAENFNAKVAKARNNIEATADIFGTELTENEKELIDYLSGIQTADLADGADMEVFFKELRGGLSATLATFAANTGMDVPKQVISPDYDGAIQSLTAHMLTDAAEAERAVLS